ncbi:MAG: multidrug effflux MFS transporter [Chlamydiia bacterium]|nr:multidrug effflux MFS transporter [Chlamydiia bacterium]
MSSLATLLQFPQILILMLLFSFLSTAAVIFTPAFPLLANQYHLSLPSAQWMMTLFNLGTALGRLPYGPLANRIGRKKTLFIGLGLSALGTLLILFSSSYPLLCVGRFIQALGCSVTLKIGYTMIGDLHSGQEATKVLSYAMLAYAILPGIGTAVGGYLTQDFGWRGGFWAFLIFTAFVIFSCLFLPETSHERHEKALNIKKIATAYWHQLKNRRLLLWSALMGLSTAILFIFAQEAPFIAIDLMNISPQAYGVFFLVPAFGIAGGSFLTVWLAHKMSARTAMLLGIGILFVGTILMTAFFLGHWISAWSLFLPQILIQLGDAVLYTNASSEAISDAEDKSNASAMMLFINSCTTVLGTFFVGVFAPKALMTLPVVFLIITGIMIVLWIRLRTLRKLVNYTNYRK